MNQRTRAHHPAPSRVVGTASDAADSRGADRAPTDANAGHDDHRTHPSSPAPAPPDYRNCRVAKTMWPPRAGTVQFLDLHGPQLVCVRYRHDANGLRRYTTIELLVDAAWIKSQKARKQVFDVPIAYEEEELRALAKQLGAKWAPERRMWELSGRAVQRLDLAHRARRTDAK
jgi:hypothetical protein